MHRTLTLLVTSLLLTATAAPAAGAAAPKPSSRASSTLKLLNRERAGHNLAPLTSNAALTRLATAHLHLDQRHDRLTRTFPGEQSLAVRAHREGYPGRVDAAEGYAMSLSASDRGTLLHIMCAKLPRRLLSSRYSQAGISVLTDRAHHRTWLMIVVGSK